MEKLAKSGRLGTGSGSGHSGKPDSLVKTMTDIRKRIDSLDSLLAPALAERLNLSRQLSLIKEELALPVRDMEREREVLERVGAVGCDTEIGQAITHVYQSIMEVSRRLQESLIDQAQVGSCGDSTRPGPLYFPKVMVIGLGLIGGSMVRQIRKLIPQTVIQGVDRLDTVRQALDQHLIDEGAPEAGQFLRRSRRASLIILAASPRANLRLLKQIAPHLRRGQLVMDVTSTKSAICNLACRLDLNGADFIGGHPLFGSERSGLESSQSIKADGRLFCLVPTDRSSEMSLRRLSRWLGMLNMEVAITDATTHDTTVAELSHLVQLLAVALGAQVACGVTDAELQRRLSLSGPSFSQVARLMSSPPELWIEILQQNQTGVLAALSGLIKKLEMMSTAITGHDGKELRELFGEAARVPPQMS